MTQPGTLVTLNLSLALLNAVGCSCRVEPGFTSAAMSANESHTWMVRTLDEIAQRAPDQNVFVGDRLARTAREELRRMSQSDPRLRRWLRTYQLAKAELHLGNENESIRLMGDALALIRDNPGEVKPEILRQFYFDMATAYLRWGETQNCCQNNTPVSCIVPFERSAIHRHQAGSKQAIQWLTSLLQMTEPEEPMYLAARWLLNLAYMTIGEYPQNVPDHYLIPGIGAGKDDSWQPWSNVASQAGVATFSLAGGAIADDFDADGDIDLIVSSSDPRESLKIMWNDGRGVFEDGTLLSGVQSILGGLNMVQTDYNNDGWMDVFVLRGGWLGKAGQHPNSLLRNNGDRTFTDITMAAGLAEPGMPTQAAAWADFDLDGDLDVYIGNESTDDLRAPSQLFRNEGNGTFTDVAAAAEVTNDRFAKAVAWGDFDGDRYPDLYVSNYRAANRLYRNQGDGTFVDVAPTLNVEGPSASFPTWFCDINNDGILDLFVAAYTGGIAEVAASLLSQPFDREATLARLYVGDAYHQFTDQAEQLGLVHPTHPMGANFGDLDSDGFVDFYFGTGWPEYHELMPNVMYHNLSGMAFKDVTNSARVGHLQKGHAVAMADFDNDGDLDLFEQMGGFVPGDKYYDVLFQNPGNQHGWICVKLVGTQSNRPAIGARIHVRVRESTAERSIYRHVSSGGSFGGNPLEQTIGLGTGEIVRLEVFWPRTGRTEIFDDVAAGQRVELTEGFGRVVNGLH